MKGEEKGEEKEKEGDGDGDLAPRKKSWRRHCFENFIININYIITYQGYTRYVY